MDVDFPLYAVRRLGGDASDTAKSAAGASERGTRAVFNARRGARVSLKGCGLLEVTSRYGLGFLEMLEGRYAPVTDLAGAAIRIADAIDADGRYVVRACTSRPCQRSGLTPTRNALRIFGPPAAFASLLRPTAALPLVGSCWCS